MQRLSYAIQDACRGLAFESQLKKHTKSRDRAYRLKKLRETPTEVIVEGLMKILEVTK